MCVCVSLRVLNEQDCSRLVEAALKAFPNDAAVQAQGCRAVAHLYKDHDNDKQVF